MDGTILHGWERQGQAQAHDGAFWKKGKGNSPPEGSLVVGAWSGVRR